ncbi:MAG TPA: glycosyltransferase [Gemmataceae bacterium]|jgi:hypothetical protein|nr:glycosyltransferase [Gemmataceae bacterium]
MLCKPACLLNRKKRRPKISVILIDWGVRESFHSLYYLNRQTADRDDYELIWLEFYDRQPQRLRHMVADGPARSPVLDKWLVLGYPDNHIYHKHRLYNVGILLAEGDICVICDSDAIFRPTFIARLLKAFTDTPNAVVHLDQVRNADPAFYPFNYPTIDAILGPGCMNWNGATTLGLANSPDQLHDANYGACMAARRRDLIAIGGADEHPDYLGYICGPYELTFRLVNYGRAERWLRNEYLYHTWHPNQTGINTDHKGPNDGRSMSLPALETRATFRVRPSVQNPWLAHRRKSGTLGVDQLLRLASQHAEPAWRTGVPLPERGDRVYWIDRDYYGFDIFNHAGGWYALRTGSGVLDPQKLRGGVYPEVWQAETQQALRGRLPIDHQRWVQLVNHRWLPARLWRKFRAQPVHRLPDRILRKARLLMAS